MCLVKSTSAAIQMIISQEAGSPKASLIANVVFGVLPNQLEGFDGSVLYEATVQNKRPVGLDKPMLDGNTRWMTLDRDEKGRKFMNLERMIWKPMEQLEGKLHAVDVNVTSSERDKYAQEAASAKLALDAQERNLRAFLENKAREDARGDAEGARDDSKKKTTSKMAEIKRQVVSAATAASVAMIRADMVSRMAVDDMDFSSSASGESGAAAAAAAPDAAVLKLNF